MTKDHFVPRLIIRRFTNRNGKIHFYNKKNNSVSPEIPHYTQLQERNFYSKKPLSKLKGIFPHISLNPIFTETSLNLEKNLDICLEKRLGKILSKILQPLLEKKKVVLTKEEEEFIKEYMAIQNLRTTAFKEMAKKIHNQILKLPENIEEIIMDVENKRKVNFKKIVKDKFPNLNAKARRLKVQEYEKKLKKQLKKDPEFIKRVRESEKMKKFLNKEIKRVEEKFERIRLHPDKHSSEILDVKLRNSFFKKCVNGKNLVFILNKTRIPFVLSDTGLVLMADDPSGKLNLEVFLPVHPNLIIGISESMAKYSIVDENFVKQFNQISKNESLINVYSNLASALNLLK